MRTQKLLKGVKGPPLYVHCSILSFFLKTWVKDIYDGETHVKGRRGVEKQDWEE